MSALARINVQQQKQRKLMDAMQEAFQSAWNSDKHCAEYRRLLASKQEKGYRHAILRVWAVNALAAACNNLAARSWPLLDMADQFLTERESEADGR